MIVKRVTRSGDRNAQAATELALVLPLLLTIVLGCIDLGRFAYAATAVANAARAGGTFVAERPYTDATSAAWNAQACQVILDELSELSGVASSQPVPVQVPAVGGFQVTACLTFHPIVCWPGLPDQIPIQQTVVVRTTRP